MFEMQKNIIDKIKAFKNLDQIQPVTKTLLSATFARTYMYTLNTARINT